MASQQIEHLNMISLLGVVVLEAILFWFGFCVERGTFESALTPTDCIESNFHGQISEVVCCWLLLRAEKVNYLSLRNLFYDYLRIKVMLQFLRNKYS